jgi:hypothetical protein
VRRRRGKVGGRRKSTGRKRNGGGRGVAGDTTAHGAFLDRS